MAGLIKKIFKKEKAALLPQSRDQGLKKEKSVKKQKKTISASDKKRLAKVYEVLESPHISEKAVFLAEKYNQYVFKVPFSANKTEAKKAIESMYGVKVKAARMIHMAPKKRRLGRREGWKHGAKRGFKKIVVTLKKGDKIENF